MISRIAAQYLDKKDAFTLKEELLNEGIESIVKLHGLPLFLGGFTNYQIQVAPEDFEKAKELIDRFNIDAEEKRKAANLLYSTQCPKCSSKEIYEYDKKSIFLKIFYFRVRVMNCKECNCKWYL